MITTVILLLLIVWVGWMYAVDRLRLERELDRLKKPGSSSQSICRSRYYSMLTEMGSRSDPKSGKASLKEQDFQRKLQDAGLDTAAEKGKYYLLKIICYVGGPFIGAWGYLGLSTYYATVFLIVSSACGMSIPFFWLKARTIRRTEEIQRELPLLIDLTNLGTSAGWDVTSSLERVVDALVVEYPKHPLIKEFAKGRLLTQTGYTWPETFERISSRLGNDAVKRCTLALGQAIKQGGDRTSQLEGIAEDAQRIFYSSLDQRLAALPVKAVLITMVLMCSYFMIILAPAVIRIKNTVL